MHHLTQKALCALLIAAGTLGAAERSFKMEADNLIPADNYKDMLGTKINIKDKKGKVYIRTLETNSYFPMFKNFNCGTVTLKYQRYWKHDLYLTARDTGTSHYRLNFAPSKNKLTLSSCLNGKWDVLKEATVPAMPAVVEIALKLDGDKVTAYMQGKEIFSEDEVLPLAKGRAGFGTSYYGDMDLISFKVDDRPPAAGGTVYEYVFSPDKNMLNDVVPTKPYVKLIGNKIKVSTKSKVLRIDSGESNLAFALQKEVPTPGCVFFKYKPLWKNSITLCARCNKNDEGRGYRLLYNPKDSKLTLSGWKNGKIVELKSCKIVPNETLVELGVGFDGKNVYGYYQGNLLLTAPDTEKEKKGYAAFSGNWYTQIAPVSFRICDKLPKAKKKSKVKAAPYRLINLRRIDPAKVTYDLNKAVKTSDGARTFYSLCQFWKFAPVKTLSGKMPSETGLFSIPGCWSGGEISDYMYLPDGRPVSEWRGEKVTDYESAWYSRTINILPSMAGKKIELYIEHMKGSYVLCLDGKVIRSSFNTSKKKKDVMDAVDAQESVKHANTLISRLYIDLTKLVTPGKTHTISVLLHATGREMRGFFGPVSLIVSPKETLGRPVIATRVAAKKMELSFLDSNAPAGSTLALKVRSVKTGKTLFEKNMPFSKELSCSFCPAGELWSPQEPNLLFADFTLKDAAGKVLDFCTRRFGFSELAIRNGKYYLNGHEIALMLESNVQGYWAPGWVYTADYYRKKFEFFRKAGINIFYFSENAPQCALDLADEYGIMVLPETFIFSHARLDKADQETFRKLEENLRGLRESAFYANHPSHVGFLIDVWYNFHTGTHNPHYTGMDNNRDTHFEIQPDGTFKKVKGHDPNLRGMYADRMKTLNKVADVYKKIFPDKECFTGGSGQVHNVFASHIYHTWGAPLAELRCYFETWSKNKELPMFIGEMTQPYVGSFQTLDNYNGAYYPFFTETNARFFGHKAYEYGGVYTRRTHHDLSREGFAQHRVEKMDSYPGFYTFRPHIYLDVLAHFLHEMQLAWRVHGVNGIGHFSYDWMIAAGQSCDMNASHPLPENYSEFAWKPSTCYRWNAGGSAYTLGKKYAPNVRPMIPYAPYKRVTDTFTFAIMNGGKDIFLQDASFYAGEKFTKTVYMMSNRTSAKEITVTAFLLNPQGRIAAKQSVQKTVPAESDLAVPVSFELPSVVKREEWRLRVKIEAKDGSVCSADEFKFRIFPKVKIPALRRKLYVMDPEGFLRKYLKKNDVSFRKLDPSDSLPESGVLLIGRKALSSMKRIPDFNALADKGLTTVIFEQDAKLSTELLTTRARTAFINAEAHPVFEGLGNADFTNFRGAFSLAPAYGKAKPGESWVDYGNRNMVASSVYRRPPHGNYKSLLVSGFDLFQTPLLEYTGKNGVVISSQLDLAERFELDPVAARLAANILSYADNAGERAGKTAAFAGKNGQEWLKKMGIQSTIVTELSKKTLNGVTSLIITDPDFKALNKYRAELLDFVYWGGKLIYIQNGKEFSPSFLPFTMGLSTAKTRLAMPKRAKGDALWLNGWEAGDLYWHEYFKVPVFTGFPEEFESTSPAVLVRGRKGCGEFVFISIIPELFGKDPASGKTDRLISAILTNAGCAIDTCRLPLANPDADTKVMHLEEAPWEFTLDPDNIGMQEEWHKGKGKARWLKGLIADGVEVRVGQMFENFVGKSYDGWAWYRLTLDVPEDLAKEDLYFIASAIDDFDEVYLNGKLIGSTGKETPEYWIAMRAYKIPAGLLKPGRNLLAVRVFDEKGGGGIVGKTVMLSGTVPRIVRGWQGPYPAGSSRDYDYKCDIVRQY